MRIWTHTDLDLKDSHPKLSHNTPALAWWRTIIPSLVAKGSGLQKVIVLRIGTHTVTLTLKIGTQTFCMTILVMVMHRHTKFHKERLSGSEGIVRTNIPRGFEPSLCPWPWGQQSKKCHTTLRLVMMHHYIPKLIAKGLKVQKMRYRRIVFLEDFSWNLDLEDWNPTFSQVGR